MPKDGLERRGPGPSAGGPRQKPREELRVLPPRQIFDHLDRYVIGQRAAKRAVATAAHQHLRRIEQRRLGAKTLLRKTNLLLMGPTGSGKTHIARNLAELLEVPFTVVDATEYTEAGYYGKDVEVMVAELLFKSGHSIDATERGIIFIDEIDKIARRSGSSRRGARRPHHPAPRSGRGEPRHRRRRRAAGASQAPRGSRDLRAPQRDATLEQARLRPGGHERHP